MTGELQATVATYDEALGRGLVLGDDGTEWSFGLGVVDAGVRLLRPGQRVRVAFVEGHIVGVTLM